MAIYHLEAKVISRGAGRSAVAAAAYMSCSQIVSDYDGIRHDYTRKRGLVWQEVFLPENAPPEWQDRAALWNAVEENEKTKDSRLAREFVAALPVELGRTEWQELLTEFIREQFVSDGMCADVCIHDTDGHNPHAHIMLTVRPLTDEGKWQYKTEKEYLCIREGEERGFTAAEFKAAQAEGWKKQYQYKAGKKKVYMAPSAAEAQGYVRVSKYPKSTKYGRQNPISERWNSEEQLVVWREKWAEAVNKYLALHPQIDARIDHRSHAARGLDEQPTVHEGVTAQALEKKGVISERCELNRQIRADNALLREMKAAVKKLTEAVANTIPAIAERLENIRSRVLIFCYQLSHIRSDKASAKKSLSLWEPELERYQNLTQQIQTRSGERKRLLAEKKSLPLWDVKKGKELAARIAELTEDLEELHTEKKIFLQNINAADGKGADVIRSHISYLRTSLEKLTQQEQKYSAELDTALREYSELKGQSADLDPAALYAARQALRPAKEDIVTRKLEQTFQKKYSPLGLINAKQETRWLLHEDEEEREARTMAQSRQAKQSPDRRDKKRGEQEL